MKSCSPRRRSSMVSKVCTHRKFSFRVRMKRSATPLPSGWRTKEGELAMPRKTISSRQALVLEAARHLVRAVVGAQREALGDLSLDAAEMAQDALAHRLERLEAVAGARGMAADAFAGAVGGGGAN